MNDAKVLGREPAIRNHSWDPAPRGRRLTWRADAVRPHESLWSLLQKFAFLNAIPLYRCASLVRWRSSPRCGYVLDLEGQNLDVAAFGAATVGRRRLEAEGMIEGYFGGPERVGNFVHFVASRLRYCLRCLEEGFHSPLHQVLLVAACPAHGVPLRERCPSCHRTIPMLLDRAKPPFGCRDCGHRFWPGMDDPAAWPRRPERDAAGDAAFAEVARWLRRTSRSRALFSRVLLVNSQRLDYRHANLAIQARRGPSLGRLPRLWREALGEEVPAVLLVGSTLGNRHYRLHRGTGRRPAVTRTFEGHVALCGLDVYNGVHRWLYHRRLRRQRAAIVEACGRGVLDRPSTLRERDRVLAWAYLSWRRWWEDCTELSRVMGTRRWMLRSAKHAVADGFARLVPKPEERLPTEPALLDRVLIYILLGTFMESVIITRAARARGDMDAHFSLSGALTPVLVRSAHPRRRLVALSR